MQRQVSSTSRTKLETHFPNQANITVAIRMAPNLTVVKGDVIGMVTSTKRGALRGNGAQSNGSERAQYFSVYSFKTDANGYVYYGEGSDLPMTGPFAKGEETAEMYFTGDFKIASLNIDPAELADVITELGAVRKGVAGDAEEWVHLP